MYRIGIVGGGPGGLFTSYFLERMACSPIEITLFEASARLGGKIQTPVFDAAPVRYEAGAAEFYDYSIFDEDPLKQLIADLGLSICPMGGPAVVLNNQVISNLDDFHHVCGEDASKSLMQFDRRARDLITPLEFCHADDPEAELGCLGSSFEQIIREIPEESARKFIETLIHSDLATEPQSTNVRYGLQNYLMNDAAYMRLYGIVGGNEQLPMELARRISAKVLLNSPVKRIESENSRLHITHEARQHDVTSEFDYVIVALPHNRLPSVEYKGEELSTAMKRHFDHYDHPASYLRITLLFDQPFWRDLCSDSYWMLDHFGGCCLYDESLRDPTCDYGVLGWLLAGKAAEDMGQESDDTLIEKALASLTQFPVDARERLLEGRVHRWNTAVSAMPGGKGPCKVDHRHQPEPTQSPHFFVVGDYLYDTTLNGVLDSAHYVASWIAADLTCDPGKQSKLASVTSTKGSHDYVCRK